MNQQEIKDYLKKNKTVAIGAPFIVLVLLLDFLVLKPARLAKKKEAAGISTAQTAVPTDDATAVSDQTPVEKAPITAPDPIITPVYSQLSPNIDIRFSANQVYPYGASRNVFIPLDKSSGVVVTSNDTTDEEPNAPIERPDISYHGFFTVGNDKVAILRLANELLLTKVGATLKHTPFCLLSVFPEKIIISDVSDGVRDFEISLSEITKDK